jgi:2-polyprenyl-3-methyl-5-hydroxy-6-metoxy-1,4-benzoquinol methylase
MNIQMTEYILSKDSTLDLDQFQQLMQEPPPYTPGKLPFWDDSYISQQMLAAHLDPESDAASRRPGTIDRITAWIVEELGLNPGDAVLDLGCGPGLYASRLAEMGLQVTGIDFSQRSIEYARDYAIDHDLAIDYRCQDYLTLEDRSQYNAVLLIYGDFCPLSPEQRRRLLANIQRALKPEGRFVLDVTRHDPEKLQRTTTNWYAAVGGFWRPGPHLVFEKTFSNPETALVLDQYTVVEENGSLSTYRVWRQDYTPESIATELNAGGFEILSIWGDLTGKSLTEDPEWIGIVARKSSASLQP